MFSRKRKRVGLPRVSENSRNLGKFQRIPQEMLKSKVEWIPIELMKSLFALISNYNLQLVSIRRCGYMDRIFYMEVGRSAVTGGGDLWMEAEDNNIAYNMHSAILSAMSSSSTNNPTIVTASNSSKDDVGPRQRGRSSSANEASKPISVLQRRHTGAKLHGYSPLGKKLRKIIRESSKPGARNREQKK